MFKPPYFLSPADHLVTDDNQHLSPDARALKFVENSGYRFVGSYWENTDHFMIEGTSGRLLLVTLPVLEAFALGDFWRKMLREDAA